MLSILHLHNTAPLPARQRSASVISHLLAEWTSEWTSEWTVPRDKLNTSWADSVQFEMLHSSWEILAQVVHKKRDHNYFDSRTTNDDCERTDIILFYVKIGVWRWMKRRPYLTRAVGRITGLEKEDCGRFVEWRYKTCLPACRDLPHKPERPITALI